MGKHSNKTDTSLTVLQWNCRGFKTSKIELINALETKLVSPDIICLQEMPKRSDIVGYKLVVHKSNSYHGSGIGIYARNEIACTEINIKQPSTPENTLYGGIKLYGKSGNTDIINVYTSPKANTNYNELCELTPQLGKKSLIVGDFNAHDVLWDPTWEHPCKKGEYLKDFLDNTNYVLLNDGRETYDCSQHPLSQKTGSTPDISLASPTLADKATWSPLDSTLGSDHYPIQIEVLTHFHRATSATMPKWKFDKADWDNFTSQCSEQLEMNPSLNINECNNEFTNKLYDISNNNIPQTSGKPHNRPTNPWWNDSCTEAIKHRETCRRKWRQSNWSNKENRLKLREEYVASKLTTNVTLNAAREQGWKDFLSRITLKQNSKEVWDNFIKLRGKKASPMSTLNNGNNTLIVDQDKADLLTQHYQTASSNANLNNEFRNLKDEMDPVIQKAIET